MSLILRLEIMGAITVEEACVEVQEAADRLGLVVSAGFNDVVLYAKPGGGAERLLANWRAAVTCTYSHKSAWSHR